MLPQPRLALEHLAGLRPPRDAARPVEGNDPSEGSAGVLACAACAQPVTTAAARIDRAGAHAHTFANPHGLVFRIGCFDRAPGCVPTSEPEARFTWFEGHAWQVAACRACGAHLGWIFSGPDRFFGLILDRLVETGDDHTSDGRSR